MSKLIVEWDRARIIAGRGHRSGQQWTMRDVHALPRAADGGAMDEISSSLRQWYPAAGKNPISAILVLPRHQVTIHRIQLPQVPEAEMPDMVRLQASLKLTVPVDTVMLDFAPLPASASSATRDVLLVTTPQDQVNPVIRLLASCQIQVTEIKISSFCLASAAAAAGILQEPTDPAVVDALVLMRDDVIEVTFVRGTSVLFAHSGASWTSPDTIEKAVRSELSRARLAAAETLGAHRIGRLLLVGQPQVTSAVSDQISSRLDQAEIQRIDPSQLIQMDGGEAGVGADALMRLAGATEDTRQVPAVDLLNPRKAPERRDLRRVKLLGGILAAVLLFAFVWNWRQSRLNELQEQQAGLDEEIATLRTTLDRGEPDLALASMLNHWVERDINWLNELDRLRQLLPGTDRMLIRNLQVGSKSTNGIGTIRLDGTAKSREDVELLGRKLTEAGYLVTPYSPGEARVSGPYPVGITLQLTIPERTADQAGKKT